MKGRMDENDKKTSRDDCNHKPVYRFYLICNMFRPLTASLFLMAFVIQMFSGQLIVLDYYANTTAFAKNCINKARPKMHCNGKCQMMKKLQQQENKDQQTPGHRSEKSPVRSAFEGTFWIGIEEGLLSFRHSSEKKKNVFFLLAL